MDGFSPLHEKTEDGFQPLDLGGADDGFEAIGPWGGRSKPEVELSPAQDSAPEEDPQAVSQVFPAVTAPTEEVDLDEVTRVALEQGYEEGFAKGLADGQRKAQQLAGEVEDLLLQLQGLRAEFFNRSVRDVADAILHISNSVVRRELSFDSSGVEQLVIDVLEDATQGDDVVIRLAPEDDRAMKDAYPSLLEALGRDGTFRVELDGSLLAGGAVIETAYGSIDASVRTQLAAFGESVQAWAEGQVEIGDE